MAKRLTDRDKKRIIADYVESGNYRETARRHGISDATVRKLVSREPQTAQKCAQKKEENAQSILAFMDSKKQTVCGLIEKFLEAMGDEDKITAAPLNQLATTMGIIIDKYTVTDRNGQALKKLDELMDKVGGVI